MILAYDSYGLIYTDPGYPAILGFMSGDLATHRTTIDIEVEPYERAKAVLGTSGYKDTINQALRQVDRAQRLRHGADAILGEKHDLTTPEELEQLRQPRG